MKNEVFDSDNNYTEINTDITTKKNDLNIRFNKIYVFIITKTQEYNISFNKIHIKKSKIYYHFKSIVIQ